MWFARPLRLVLLLSFLLAVGLAGVSAQAPAPSPVSALGHGVSRSLFSISSSIVNGDQVVLSGRAPRKRQAGRVQVYVSSTSSTSSPNSRKPPRSWSLVASAKVSPKGTWTASFPLEHEGSFRVKAVLKMRGGPLLQAGLTIHAASAPHSADPNAYTYLGTAPDGSPARWDPCTSVDVYLNPGQLPDDVSISVEEVLAAVSEAARVPLVFKGASSYIPYTQTDGLADLADAPYPAIFIAFVDVDAYQHLSGDRVAFGGFSFNPESGRIARGGAVLEYTVYTEGSLAAVLMHELGHVFGLAHSPDPDQLMYESYSEDGPQFFQAGDLNGLKHQADLGCFPS